MKIIRYPEGVELFPNPEEFKSVLRKIFETPKRISILENTVLPFDKDDVVNKYILAITNADDDKAASTAVFTWIMQLLMNPKFLTDSEALKEIIKSYKNNKKKHALPDFYSLALQDGERVYENVFPRGTSDCPGIFEFMFVQIK